MERKAAQQELIKVRIPKGIFVRSAICRLDDFTAACISWGMRCDWKEIQKVQKAWKDFTPCEKRLLGFHWSFFLLDCLAGIEKHAALPLIMYYVDKKRFALISQMHDWAGKIRVSLSLQSRYLWHHQPGEIFVAKKGAKHIEIAATTERLP